MAELLSRVEAQDAPAVAVAVAAAGIVVVVGLIKLLSRKAT